LVESYRVLCLARVTSIFYYSLRSEPDTRREAMFRGRK